MENFLRTEFSQAFNGTSGLSVEEIWRGGARVRGLREALRENLPMIRLGHYWQWYSMKHCQRGPCSTC